MANRMTGTWRSVVSVGMRAAMAASCVAMLVACVDGEASSDAQQAEAIVAQDAERLADAIVGRWQFVYTDDRRAEVERRLATEIEDPAALEAAKAEAVAEASASVIELTADRRYVSRIGDDVLLDARFDARMHSEGGLALSPVGNDGPSIRVELTSPDTLVMHDPRKGPLTFTRK